MEKKFKLIHSFSSRLVIVAQKCDELEAPLKYELCSYPPSLFDSSLHEAKKPALANAIWKLVGPDVSAENVVATSTSWMVEHFFNASHGPRDLLTKTYSTNIQIM